MTRRWIDVTPPPSPDAEQAQALLRSLDPAPPPGAAQRVWRRLEARESRPAARRAWVLVPALGAAVAAALVLVAVGREGPSVAPSGGAVARVVAGDVQGARAGEVLARGARVVVGEGGRIGLDLEGSALTLEGRGALVVRADGVVLEAGVVEVVSPQRAVAVIAGPWRVDVAAGEVRWDGALAVASARGTTVVRGPEGVIEVEEGKGWRSGMAAAASAASAAGSGDALRRELGGAPVEAPVARSEVVRSRDSLRARGAPARVAAPEASARVAVPEASARVADVAPARVAPPEPPPSRPAVAGVAADRFSVPAIPRAEAPQNPIPAPRGTAPVAPPAVPALWDEDAHYRRARAEPDPARALELFDAVIAHNGALAEVAALQAAELQLRRGHVRDAESRFRLLLLARPGTALAPEVQRGLIECSLRSGDLQETRAEIDAALAAGRPGTDVAGLYFLRGELSRRAGHCLAAVADYRQVTQGRHADDAAFHTAWCLLTLDEADGEAALHAYLERHPSGRHAAKVRARLATKKE